MNNISFLLLDSPTDGHVLFVFLSPLSNPALASTVLSNYPPLSKIASVFPWFNDFPLLSHSLRITFHSNPSSSFYSVISLLTPSRLANPISAPLSPNCSSPLFAPSNLSLLSSTLYVPPLPFPSELLQAYPLSPLSSPLFPFCASRVYHSSPLPDILLFPFPFSPIRSSPPFPFCSS